MSKIAPQNANLLQESLSLQVTDIQNALSGNARLMSRLGELFHTVDVLLCPAFPMQVPYANGTFSLFSQAPFTEWFSNLLNGMRYGVLANESGLPALCLPAGLVNSLPVGVQIYGKPGADGLLLQLGAQVEDNAPEWFGATPPLSVSSVAHSMVCRYNTSHIGI